MMLYQMAANKGWRSWLADASSAFLQGETTEEEWELYALPVPQLREAIGLNDDDMVQILKGVGYKVKAGTWGILKRMANQWWSLQAALTRQRRRPLQSIEVQVPKPCYGEHMVSDHFGPFKVATKLGNCYGIVFVELKWKTPWVHFTPSTDSVAALQRFKLWLHTRKITIPPPGSPNTTHFYSDRHQCYLGGGFTKPLVEMNVMMCPGQSYQKDAMTGLVESRINTLEGRARAMRHQARRAFELFGLDIDKYYEYFVWTAADLMEWMPVKGVSGVEAIPYLAIRNIVCTRQQRIKLFQRCFPAVFGCIATYNVPSESSVAKTGGDKYTKDRSFAVIFLGRMPAGKRLYAGVGRRGKVWEGINFEFSAADQIGRLRTLPAAQQDGGNRDFSLEPEPPPTNSGVSDRATIQKPSGIFNCSDSESDLSEGEAVSEQGFAGTRKVAFADVPSPQSASIDASSAPTSPSSGVGAGAHGGVGVPPLRVHGTRSQAAAPAAQQLFSEVGVSSAPVKAAQPPTHGHGTRSRTGAKGKQPTSILKDAQYKEVGSVAVGPMTLGAQHKEAGGGPADAGVQHKEVGSVTVRSASQGVQLEDRVHVCLQGGGDVVPLTGQVNLRETLQPIFASIVHDDFDFTTNERCRANWALLGTCVGDLSLSLLHEASPLLAAAVADAVGLEVLTAKIKVV